MVCKVQSLSTKLDEARSNLGLLQEAVGVLQPDVVACDAKIDAVLEGFCVVLPIRPGGRGGRRVTNLLALIILLMRMS